MSTIRRTNKQTQDVIR